MLTCSVLLLSAALQLPPGSDVTTSQGFLLQAGVDQRTSRSDQDGDLAVSATLLAPVLEGSPSAHIQRIAAYGASGQLLWQDDTYFAGSGLSAAENRLAIESDESADSVYWIKPGVLQFQLSSLDASDGSLRWIATDMGPDPQTLNRVFHLDRVPSDGPLLGVLSRGTTLRFAAWEPNTGVLLWSTDVSNLLPSNAPSSELAFSPDGSRAWFAFKNGSNSFGLLRVLEIDLTTTETSILNDSYNCVSFGMSASSDGNELALGLGRSGSARVVLLNASSGAAKWVYVDPSTEFTRKPSVAFVPDSDLLISGFSRLGSEAGSAGIPGARFVGLNRLQGSAAWTYEADSNTASLSPFAQGPQFPQVDSATHVRTYTLRNAQGQHVQQLELADTTTGAVLADQQVVGSSDGILHQESLGVDSAGQVWSYVLIEGDLPISGTTEKYGLARWPADLSDAYQVLPIDDKIPQQGRMEVAAYHPGTRSVALLETSVGLDVPRVLVVDADTGEPKFETTLETLSSNSLDTAYALEFSDSGEEIVIRAQSAVFSNRVWVYSIQTGALLWLRDLENDFTPGSTLANQPTLGQSGLSVQEGRVLVSEGDASVGGTAALLRCLDLQTGLELWSEGLSRNQVSPAPIAGFGDRVYASRQIVVQGQQGLGLVELDLATGQELRVLPLAAPYRLTGLYAAEDGLGLWATRTFSTNPNTSERAWVFDRLGFDLLDSLDAEFKGVQAMGKPDGFAFLRSNGFKLDQLGKRDDPNAPPTPSKDGWIATANSLSSTIESLSSLDGGKALVWVETTGSTGKQIRCIDSRSGEDLWEVDAQILSTGSVSDVVLANSDKHELQAWSSVVQSTSPFETGPGVETQWTAIGLPDVLVSPSALSASSGGVAELLLRGESSPGDLGAPLYVVLGGLEEVSAGLPFQSVQLPFAADDLFLALTLTFNPTYFDQFIGFLDVNGNGVAGLTVPAGTDPTLAGLDFLFCFLELEQGPVSGVFSAARVSGTAPLTLVP